MPRRRDLYAGQAASAVSKRHCAECGNVCDSSGDCRNEGALKRQTWMQEPIRRKLDGIPIEEVAQFDALPRDWPVKVHVPCVK